MVWSVTHLSDTDSETQTLKSRVGKKELCFDQSLIIINIRYVTCQNHGKPRMFRRNRRDTLFSLMVDSVACLRYAECSRAPDYINIGFLGRWGTYAYPQCLPSGTVPIRSWTRTPRRPGIRHRHLPYHTIPYHTISIESITLAMGPGS